MILYTFAASIVIISAIYFIARGNIFNYFLFVVFIFNLEPGVINLKISESFPEIKLNQILVIVLIVWMVIGKYKIEEKKFDGWLLYSMVILLLFRFLSIFYSIEPALSLRVWVITLFTWFFFYYAVIKLVQSVEQLDLLCKVLLISALVVAFFNFIELLTGINLTQNPSFTYYERYGIPRVHGLLGDPVATAYYLLPIIPFGFYLFFKYKKNVWLIITISIIVSLIPNFARITFISLMLMLIAYNILFLKNKVKYILISVVIFTLIFFTDNVIKQSMVDSLYDVQYGGNTSFDVQRTSITPSTVFSMIQQVPLFGLGVGSLTRNELLLNYFSKVGFMYVTESVRTELPIVVTFALECGIGASIFFIIMYFRGLKISFNLSRLMITDKNNISKYVFLSLLGYFICLISNGVTNSLNILFILLGISNKLLNIQSNQKKTNIIETNLS